MTVKELNEINETIDSLIVKLKDFENSSPAIDSLLTAQLRVNTIYQDENKRHLQDCNGILPIELKGKDEKKGNS